MVDVPFKGKLSVAVDEQSVFFKIDGRADHIMAYILNQAVQLFGPRKLIYIDASDCIHMDSTFIGQLIRLSVPEENEEPTCLLSQPDEQEPACRRCRVVLMQPKEAIIQIFKSMHVLDLIQLTNEIHRPVTEYLVLFDSQSSQNQICSAFALDSQAIQSTVALAHKRLVELRPELREKFEPLLNLLQANGKDAGK